jgi:hypothetical protein
VRRPLLRGVPVSEGTAPLLAFARHWQEPREGPHHGNLGASNTSAASNMVQILISHAEQDRAVAERLAGFLQGQGRSVSWGGTQRRDAASHVSSMAELAAAKLVIVIWSKSSVAAAFVLQEAIAARDAQKILHVVNSDAQPKAIPLRDADEPMLDVSDLLQISLAVFWSIK